MHGQSDPVIDKLIARINDPDPIVRRNAVGALRLHGLRAAAAIPALCRLTDDEDYRVRAEVQRTLNQLRNSAA